MLHLHHTSSITWMQQESNLLLQILNCDLDETRTRTNHAVQGIFLPLQFHYQMVKKKSRPINNSIVLSNSIILYLFCLWSGLFLFVVVRGFEPLREEPKSPMLTITSHNNNQPRLYLTTYLSSDTITLKINTQ